MRKTRSFWMWGSCSIAMAACCCGGQPAPPAAPSQGFQSQPAQPGYAAKKAESLPESRRPEADQAAPPTPAAPAPPPPAAAGAPPAEPVPEAPGAMDPRARYARANVQLSEARRQLDIAAGQRDCANACRALDSMERAAVQICELARSTEERRTCKAAEDQVGSARERVKNACGVCPKKP
jgi:hypothetical protein